MRRSRRLALVAVAAAALTALTTLRICDVIFDCGCTWPFLGGAAHCNMHAPRPPHCPACRDRATGALLVLGLFSAWAGLGVAAGGRDLP